MLSLGQSLKREFAAAVAVAVVLASQFTLTAQNKVETGASPPPTFSVPSGVYSNNIKLRLSSPAASSVIHYTLDGSEPGAKSAVYSEPLSVTNSTLIRAKVFCARLAPGPTLSQTYTLVDESLIGFSSNLPLIIINTFGEYISHDTKTPISIRIINPAGGRSTPLAAADFDGRGTVNLRGRSSLEYRKHSFTLHTVGENGEAQKAPLLGMPKESAWVLYAPYPDKTLMRDVLAYDLSNRMGRYAPHTRFVEVFISRAGGRLSRKSYFGVYVFEEKIKRSRNRVNIEKLGPDDNAEPAISGGYIFKKDHMDKGKPGFRTSHGNHFLYVEPKAEEITAPQKKWLVHYLNQLEGALYGPDFKDPVRGYAAYLDVDSLIDYHWIVEATKNVDGIRFSNFLQKDRGGKIKMEPIWDWNLSFGNANGKQGWVPQGWYWPQLEDNEYLWFRRLFEDPNFEQKYVDRWGVLRTNILATSNVLARVDAMASQLQEAQTRNFKRWPILGRFVNPNYYVGQTYEEEVNWMKDWIRSRISWIDGQFLSPVNCSLKEGAAAPGSTLTLRARSGKIYYTLDGTDPRAPGGAVSSKALLYDSPIALPGNAHLFARARQGSRWSSPTVLRFTASPGGRKQT